MTNKNTCCFKYDTNICSVIALELYNFCYLNINCELVIPVYEKLKEGYLESKKDNLLVPFPYWAKLWASSIALAEFIVENTALFKNKRILELAGGLGLPSIVASAFADEVLYSDYERGALEVVNDSIKHNSIINTKCMMIDWHNIPKHLSADVLLMSDVNYNPKDFEALLRVFEHFLNTGTTILLSTPHRIAAKPFIASLQHFCIQQEHKIVYEGEVLHDIAILVLKKV